MAIPAAIQAIGVGGEGLGWFSAINHVRHAALTGLIWVLVADFARFSPKKAVVSWGDCYNPALAVVGVIRCSNALSVPFNRLFRQGE